MGTSIRSNCKIIDFNWFTQIQVLFEYIGESFPPQIISSPCLFCCEFVIHKWLVSVCFQSNRVPLPFISAVEVDVG